MAILQKTREKAGMAVSIIIALALLSFIIDPQHFILQLPQQPVFAHGFQGGPFRFQRQRDGGKLYGPGYCLTVLIFYQAGTADTELSRGAFLGPVQAPSPQDQVKAGQSAALPCSVPGFVPAGTASFPCAFFSAGAG